jgi:hypothetical protein
VALHEDVHGERGRGDLHRVGDEALPRGGVVGAPREADLVAGLRELRGADELRDGPGEGVDEVARAHAVRRAEVERIQAVVTGLSVARSVVDVRHEEARVVGLRDDHAVPAVARRGGVGGDPAAEGDALSQQRGDGAAALHVDDVGEAEEERLAGADGVGACALGVVVGGGAPEVGGVVDEAVAVVVAAVGARGGGRAARVDGGVPELLGPDAGLAVAAGHGDLEPGGHAAGELHHVAQHRALGARHRAKLPRRHGEPHPAVEVRGEAVVAQAHLHP